MRENTDRITPNTDTFYAVFFILNPSIRFILNPEKDPGNFHN